MKKNERDLLFLIFIFLASLAAIMPFLRVGLGQNDLNGYWSSTRLLFTGGNPYSSDELMALQEQAGPGNSIRTKAMMVWNPPWLMLVLMPISLLPFSIAARAWLLINIFLIGISILLTWTLLNRSVNERIFLILLGICFIFVPTIILLELGQISTIILFSLILFIVLVEKKRDCLAGMVLLMTTIKPHITYLVLLVILIWIIRNQRWKVAFSLLATGLLSVMITWLINPSWIQDYIRTLNSLPYNDLSTSTLGSFMSEAFGIQTFRYTFVLLLPLAFPLAKAAEKTGFLTAFNLALLISIPLSPYGFAFDQILLLPAIAQIVSWVAGAGRPALKRWLAASGLAAVFVLNIWIASQSKMLYSYFFWVPLALLPVYLLTVKIFEPAVKVTALNRNP
jgi:hypothetical protein